MTPKNNAFINTVMCDNSKCDWQSSEKVDVHDWHNKMCPKCGQCVIISDEDMEICNRIQALMDAGLAFGPGNAPEGMPVIGVKLNTGALRDHNGNPL